MASTKEYQCIPKGAGGTFKIHEGSRRIGTIGCDISVGVYFQVDSERAFCAHMSVGKSLETLSEEEGSRLSVEVCKKLKDVAKREGWQVDRDGLGNELGSYATLVCKRPTYQHGKETKKGPGWYIVEGVIQFFNGCLKDLNWKACEAHAAAEDAVEYEGPEGEEFTKPGLVSDHQKALDTRAVNLCARLHMMAFVAIPKLDARRESRGFVIENISPPKRLRLRQEDGRSVDWETGDVEEGEYVPRDETLVGYEWHFS